MFLIKSISNMELFLYHLLNYNLTFLRLLYERYKFETGQTNKLMSSNQVNE